MTSITKPDSPKADKNIHYFITYGICFISLGLGMAAMGPLLPFMAEKVDVTFAKISFLFTASSLGYLVGSVGGGRLYDHFKGHRLMIFAIGQMIIMSFFIPLIPQFYFLIGGIFLFGLSQGMLDVGANVHLLWIYQSRVGPFMNGLHFFFGVGAFLSPIIIHHAMRLFGESLKIPFWTLAILFIPSMVGLWFLKSPVNPEKLEPSQHPKKIDTRLILLMMTLFFIYVGVEAGFGGWIFTYAFETKIASKGASSYMNAVFWGALTAGRLLSIPLSKKFAPSKILICNFSLAILFLGMILIWPLNAIVVWISAAGLGLGLSSVFPTLLALGETRMKITGGVTGLFFLGSSLGGTLLPMLLGQIFEYIGSYQIMLTLFSVAFAGLIVLISVIIASNRVGEKARS